MASTLAVVALGYGGSAVALQATRQAPWARSARPLWSARPGGQAQPVRLLAAPESWQAHDPVWGTCTPLAAHLDGPYRIYNDAWASRECITSTGPNLRVLTSARPSGGDVVAYPDIQYGSAYGYATPGSDLPVRLSRMGHPLLSATAAGRASGAWIADFDSWFFRTSDTGRHGTTEMIIVMRYMPGMAHGKLIRIGRTRWWLRDAVTCNSGLCWPLIRYFAARQTRHVRRLPFRAFTRIAEHRGMLPAGDWWGSTSFGFELWSGGRGLAAGMTVLRYPRRARHHDRDAGPS